MDGEGLVDPRPRLGRTLARCVLYSGCILVPALAAAALAILLAWRFLFGMDPPPSDRSLRESFAAHREAFIRLRDALLSDPRDPSREDLEGLGIESASVEPGPCVRFAMRTRSILRFLFRDYRKEIVYCAAPPSDPPPEGARIVPLGLEGWTIRLRWGEGTPRGGGGGR